MTTHTLPTEDQKLLLKIITRSLIEVAEKDIELVEKNAHEQALSHRLAVYIEKHFQEEVPNFIQSSFDLVRVSVDCEYNRHEHEEKSLEEILLTYPNKKSDIVRPDIVLHIRGESSNLIVVEITKGDDADFKYAFEKVSAFVNSAYAYSLGVVVRMDTDTNCSMPYQQIATVRTDVVMQDNQNLLKYIGEVIDRRKYMTIEEIEDEEQELRDSTVIADEDDEERRSHSDEVNKEEWTSTEEGWPYKDEE